ncbi:alpha/beta fold hydrolase [Microbacter sp. GSS18]|nr:alpha/beta fold hydrolase [Microbacter sp. GSS18]
MVNLIELARVQYSGVRQAITRTPAEVGLEYEDVAFPATDGVMLRGWFIPADVTPAPTVVWVHGWPWNRLGNVAGQVPWSDRDVDFLPCTRGLHDGGFNVLMFDLANHGESDARPPLTYGEWESRDVAGAMAFLRAREEVVSDRIGAIGTSAGGSTVLYGTAAVQPIGALLVVQPTTVRVFRDNLARDLLGGIGPVFARTLSVLYWLRGAPSPGKHDPAVPARDLGDTVVQYVQGTGDQWGTMADVERMEAATPRSLGIIAYPSEERYGGYQYINTHTDDVVEFFRRYV